MTIKGYFRSNRAQTLIIRDSRKTKLEDIFDEYREKRYQAGRDYDTMQDLHDAEYAEIQNVLTAEQQKQLENRYDGRYNRHCSGGFRGRGRGFGGRGPGVRR